jgi:thiamine kinase-like enzyme
VSATILRWIVNTCLEKTPRGTIRSTNSEPLVLTDQDPNLRNVIVGEDGRLWVVDWSWAGYYLPRFEYAAMQRQNEDKTIWVGRMSPGLNVELERWYIIARLHPRSISAIMP